MTVWLNDRLVPDADARVSVLDHGFTVGDGVFETLAIRDGVPIALTRHLRRLRTSALGLGLPDPDLVRIRDAVTAVVDADRLVRGRLRITWTSGPGALGSGRDTGEPTLVIVAVPTPAWPPTTTVAVVPWPRNEHSAIAGLKTTSYAENVVALAHARSLGADEAVLLNTAGRVCEGASTNIIVVVDGRLLTPSLASGCLAGITRELAIEWCGVEEAELTLRDLVAADEVMLTSSTRDLHPVSSLIAPEGTRTLPAPGPVSRRAMATFAERLASTPDP